LLLAVLSIELNLLAYPRGLEGNDTYFLAWKIASAVVLHRVSYVELPLPPVCCIFD